MRSGNAYVTERARGAAIDAVWLRSVAARASSVGAGVFSELNMAWKSRRCGGGIAAGTLACVAARAGAQPYELSEATDLLNAELANLGGHVAVIVRQDGRDVYRFQAGDIGYGTKTRLASFTKTLSAGVVLSVRDSGQLALDERVGDTITLMSTRGIGDATVTDCFGMRHGISTPIAYEIDSRFTLSEAVNRIALTGTQSFTPGAALEYDGVGMEVVGRICELKTGLDWDTLSRQRIFDPCGMGEADYEQFAPNPAIAGGARSSAEETIRFAQMVIDGGWNAGWNNGTRVLSQASVDQLFTNSTQGLPVLGSPWPASSPTTRMASNPTTGLGRGSMRSGLMMGWSSRSSARVRGAASCGSTSVAAWSRC